MLRKNQGSDRLLNLETLQVSSKEMPFITPDLSIPVINQNSLS